ncbi:hypothetical protein KJ640_03545 [bacterium]|nr:hypothetical protein [bacterium]
MNLKVLVLTLKTDQPITQSATMLRGFVANRFPEQPILHQHERNGFIYLYPRVQYKIIDGIAKIIGLAEGVDVVKDIWEKIEELKLGAAAYQIKEKVIVERGVGFGVNGSPLTYSFLTPWLALNQKNYQEWQALTKSEKQERLKRTLIGNILSMATGLEYVVTEEIKAEVDVRPVPATLKGVPMIGFLGKFQVNFNIPDYLGLGKSVSRGFGTIINRK